MIVLDTNVVSEIMKPGPSEAVSSWVRHRSAGTQLWTTSITLAEVLFGIALLPAGRRKDQLQVSATDLFEAFAHQVLPFDALAAQQYASIADARRRLGRPIAGFDAQIAAICASHDAALATRNVKDFEHTGIELIDPWQED
jgi:predicted nucleic acid-binding protein